tara:strand:- start:265 stop:567 length:303 start_codon:yes stop_codon:yes gene_type:complete
MNYINLDEFETAEEISFTFKEKTHVMQPLPVGDFIKQSKALKKIRDNGEVEDSAQFMLDAIRAAFPTLSAADASKMTMDQIRAVMALVSDEVEEAQEEGN